MPEYEVIVTRDVTESATIQVTADSEEDAEIKAVQQSKNALFFKDDGSDSDPYTNGADEIHEVEVEPTDSDS